MPAKSSKQANTARMAMAMKKGEMPMKGAAGQMAKTMTQKQLKDMMHTAPEKKKGK